MIRSGEANLSISIELTPIIDMVFLLLIFFLVATTFHQTEREMQIVLPESRWAGPVSTVLREIIINVDAEGQIIVSGRLMDPEQLRSLVTATMEANPEQKVTVRGDRHTAYANIVRVLDICKGAGVQEPYLDTVIQQE